MSIADFPCFNDICPVVTALKSVNMTSTQFTCGTTGAYVSPTNTGVVVSAIFSQVSGVGMVQLGIDWQLGTINTTAAPSIILRTKLPQFFFNINDVKSEPMIATIGGTYTIITLEVTEDGTIGFVNPAGFSNATSFTTDSASMVFSTTN